MYTAYLPKSMATTTPYFLKSVSELVLVGCTKGEEGAAFSILSFPFILLGGGGVGVSAGIGGGEEDGTSVLNEQRNVLNQWRNV